MQAVLQDMEYAASLSILTYKSGLSVYLLQTQIKSKNIGPVESCEERRKHTLSFNSLQLKENNKGNGNRG